MHLTFEPRDILEALRAQHPEIPAHATIRVARPARPTEVKRNTTKRVIEYETPEKVRKMIAVLGCVVEWTERNVELTEP